jgi:uncharacterized protein
VIITWDEPKRRANLENHGIDLADAEQFDWDGAVYVATHPGKRGQPRVQAIGHLADHLVSLIYSPLGTEAVSVISIRPANRKERRLYDRQ